MDNFVQLNTFMSFISVNKKAELTLFYFAQYISFHDEILRQEFMNARDRSFMTQRVDFSTEKKERPKPQYTHTHTQKKSVTRQNIKVLFYIIAIETFPGSTSRINRPSHMIYRFLCNVIIS